MLLIMFVLSINYTLKIQKEMLQVLIQNKHFIFSVLYRTWGFGH